MSKELERLFNKYDDEYGNFVNVKNKLSRRPDVHAIIMLDQLFPPKNKEGEDLIGELIDYRLYLDIDEIIRLTEEQVLDLVRCSVCYDRYDGSFYFLK